MKIYTRTGDRGETGLYGGKRVPKDDPIIEALGSLDELNAMLGNLELPLDKIQKDLQTIASQIAGHKGKTPSVKRLENEIDRMEKDLPELHNFILPKGPVHLARAICRRAERRVVAVAAPGRAKYLNRLSDYLFVLARWMASGRSSR